MASFTYKRPKELEGKRIALVHDWLIAGGAEKVVLELHRMFPEAPIYTSYCTDEWRKKLDGKVITGFLQRWPFPKIRKFIPFLRIWWFTRLKFDDYDIVISTTGAEAKGINTPKGTLHISYIHAPTHYYWSRYEEYLQNPGFGKLDWLARFGLKLLVGPLRRWDYRAAHKADYVIGNSTHISRLIKKYYDIDSATIFPPFDMDKFKKVYTGKRSGFMVLGRHTPYKRMDLAVQACTELNLPLTVVGKGPDTPRLKQMAGPTVKFTGFAPDSEIADIFGHSEAFLFPGVDDFGISPLEAMACGTPVIAYKAGGALDYVNPTTGLFFEEQTADSLKSAIKEFRTKSYSPHDIKKSAERFSNENFAKTMTAEILKALQ